MTIDEKVEDARITVSKEYMDKYHYCPFQIQAYKKMYCSECLTGCQYADNDKTVEVHGEKKNVCSYRSYRTDVRLGE